MDTGLPDQTLDVTDRVSEAPGHAIREQTLFPPRWGDSCSFQVIYEKQGRWMTVKGQGEAD